MTIYASLGEEALCHSLNEVSIISSRLRSSELRYLDGKLIFLKHFVHSHFVYLSIFKLLNSLCHTLSDDLRVATDNLILD